MTGYSHIVIGAGAIGSAAAYRLSAQGARKVLVVEQFDLINTLNSSGDHSRIIRRAYHHDAYVNLTSAMFSAWEEIEHLSGLTVYTRTGGLDMAPAEGRGAAELEAFKQPLRNAGIPFDELSAEDIRAEYPQWVISDDTVGFFSKKQASSIFAGPCRRTPRLLCRPGWNFFPARESKASPFGTTP